MFPVSKRTQQEAYQTHLNDYVRQSKMDAGKNNWLMRAEVQAPKSNPIVELARVQKRKKEIVEQRRNKLKALIDAEEAEYRTELFSLQKSPEQMIEEMRTKVAKLKEENERERVEEVQRLRTLQIKTNAEELKLISQKAAEVRTQIEREFQVREKRDIIAQIKEEERLFAHLTKLQIRDKILEERKKKEEKMEKIKIQNSILKKQIEDIEVQKAKELDALEAENKNFREVCKKLLLDEKQKLEKQREINRKLAEEVKVFNELQQIQKEEKKRHEEEEDKRLLEAQLERERLLAELEERQKEKYKQETREFLKQIKARTDEMKLNQKVIDQLINEEIELQWRKRQEVWEREEKARIKLLKEVYAHRYDNIEEKKQKKVDLRHEKAREKEEMKKLAVQYDAQEKQELMDELRKMNLYREAIMRQVKEKYEFDQKEKFKEMEEERKRHLMELEYQQAVEAEMRKGEQMIEEIKRLRNLA